MRVPRVAGVWRLAVGVAAELVEAMKDICPDETPRRGVERGLRDAVSARKEPRAR